MSRRGRQQHGEHSVRKRVCLIPRLFSGQLGLWRVYNNCKSDETMLLFQE
jgi:hypothetical protein